VSGRRRRLPTMRCGGTPRQQRCSGGRPWLEEGPAAPKEGGDGEGDSKSKQCRAVVVLIMKGGGNVVATMIQPLLMSSGTTVWTRRRPGRLGGDDAQFWWLSCGEEGGVGDKCLTAPRVEAEKKLGEEMLDVHQLKGGEGGVSGTVRHEGGRGRPVAREKQGGPVSWPLWAGSRRKGNRPGEKKIEVGPTRMNSADFDLNQISKLI
jgi:hypothetical protein